MGALMKKFLLFASVIAVCFSAYAFIQERPTKLVSASQDALEKKIAEERLSVLAYVDVKDQAKTAQLQAVNQNLNEKFGILMKMLERMDDRLYDLQRGKEQSARSSGGDDSGT